MKKFIGIVVILAIVCVFGYVHFANAEEVLLKKVDYVSVIVDQSGSMYMKDKCHKETKMAIAKKAIELKTGARGLRTILEERMLDVMYSCHFEEDIKKITITADFINKIANPKITKFTEKKTKKKTA